MGTKKFVHMSPTEISAGMDLFKAMPELNGLVEVRWKEKRVQYMGGVGPGSLNRD